MSPTLYYPNDMFGFLAMVADLAHDLIFDLGVEVMQDAPWDEHSDVYLMASTSTDLLRAGWANAMSHEGITGQSTSPGHGNIISAGLDWACPGCGGDEIWANGASHGCDDSVLIGSPYDTYADAPNGFVGLALSITGEEPPF